MDPKLRTSILSIKNCYEKLLFILVKDDSSSMSASEFLHKEFNADVLNISLELAKFLLPEIEAKYPFLINNKIQQAIDLYSSKFLVLRNIELLFHSSLKLNVIQSLLQISRHRPIIVIWPGEFNNQYLIYANPNHPEYVHEYISGIPVFSYSNKDIRYL
ncbi:MAG: BREX-3 system P-loop-containing protein BrxF [Tissierellales bacterium]|nr:BREX-3 system P-loop-containing protein BrxF [Tissierellales bacterium]